MGSLISSPGGLGKLGKEVWVGLVVRDLLGLWGGAVFLQ